MKFSKTLTTIISLLLLTSCANLDILKKKHIHGNNFNAELSRNYLMLADREAKQYDWIDSNHFAIKGREAAKGKAVLPEDISKWDIDKEHRAELTHARAELLAALTNENKISFPKEAADAQSYFDCWVEEQEENWQQNDILACKTHYKAAINALQNVILKAKTKLVIISPKLEPKREEKIEDKFTIYFDFDKSNINKTEEETLSKAIDAVHKLKSTIRLDGHADEVGPEKYNDILSAKRAKAVEEYLKAHGVEKESFELHHHGKREPVVKTGHAKERLNRRVEIHLGQNQK